MFENVIENVIVFVLISAGEVLEVSFPKLDMPRKNIEESVVG